MKIMQINSVCGTGSTGRIATDIYKIMKDNHHECIIAYGRDDAKNIDVKDTIKIESKIGVKIHAVLSRIFDKTGFYSRYATKKLIEKIKKINPDLIHLHNIHGYYINIEILFKYLSDTNKPVVWTLHDCWAFTGHCSHYDFVGCDRWKTMCYDCCQKSAYPKSIFVDNSRWNYKKKKELFTGIANMTIVTPSIWLAREVKKSYLNKYPVQVIYNGIDLNEFKKTPSEFLSRYGIQGKRVVLGVASVWDEEKGYYDFIKLRDILDSEFVIVMVGLTQKQIDKLPNGIIGIKRTNSIKELAEIYTAADVFVNTSVEETMGLVTVEALACGTPAIVYNATAVPETIDDSCGIVVEKGNVHKIKEAIYCIDKEKMENKCIERAKKFGKKNYIEYLRLYESLLENNI